MQVSAELQKLAGEWDADDQRGYSRAHLEALEATRRLWMILTSTIGGVTTMRCMPSSKVKPPILVRVKALGWNCGLFSVISSRTEF